MQFNSYPFLVFAFSVFPLYYCLRHRAQNAMLLAASYVFYAMWDWRFLSLIFISTIVDYVVSKKLGRSNRPTHRRVLLCLSLSVNLGLLAAFKYFGFFVRGAEHLLSAVGIPCSGPSLHIILPVGISFYTFQTMGYTIDVYRGAQEPVKRLDDFALFVAFFPQLVAGPIERASRLLPQLVGERRVGTADVRQAVWLLTYGFFKKVVVADNLGFIVDRQLAGGAPEGGLLCLATLYCFAFQIYADFSGYTDIARGLSKLFGIHLVENFDRPYFSKSPREFWRRWHMSLSSWFRDYLYIPLGGARRTAGRNLLNVMVTMGLCGLWHGASGGFVLWGIYHGVLLVGHRLLASMRQEKELREPWMRLLKRLATFHLVLLGWLLFRAETLAVAWKMVREMFSVQPSVASALSLCLSYLAVFALPLLVLDAAGCHRDELQAKSRVGRAVIPLLHAVLWVAIATLQPPKGSSFIYFQF